jgi:hypothetical protein
MKSRRGNIASDFEFHHGAKKRRQDAGATNVWREVSWALRRG